MSPGKRRSSRNRMARRLGKQAARPTPVILFDKKGESYAANRAAKKQRVAMMTKAAGLSVVQKAAEKRKANLKKANRALRKMRKETQRAMRAAAGGV